MFKFYIIIFTISVLVSLLVTPLVRRASVRMGFLDRPNRRKVNKQPVPLLGGLAIYAAFIAAMVFFAFTRSPVLDMQKFIGMIGGSFIVVLAGIEDDIRGLSPKRKLFYQATAAMIAYLFGYSIIKLTMPFGGAFHLPDILGMGLTVLWIVGFINAVNLLDGLDGLSAGVVGIVAISLFFAAVRSDNPVMAVLSIGIAASVLGFLPYNFYPAKIFMGDTGSMFLGFILALITIECAYKGATFITLSLPVVAMGVPVADTALSIIRRVLSRKKVFTADKEHIHHKLMFMEGSQKKAVLTLYLMTAYLGLISIALSRMEGVWGFAAVSITIVLVLRCLVNLGIINMRFAKDKDEK